MSANKWLIGTGIAAVATTVTVASYRLLSKQSASGKLSLDISGFKMIDFVKKSINPYAIFRTTFDVKNPSAEELSFTQPFIELKAKSKKGATKNIATSPASDKVITLKPKSNTNLDVDIEIRAFSAIGVITDFIGFLIRKIKGEPPSKEVTLAYSYSSEGIDFRNAKKVLI